MTKRNFCLSTLSKKKIYISSQRTEIPLLPARQLLYFPACRKKKNSYMKSMREDSITIYLCFSRHNTEPWRPKPLLCRDLWEKFALWCNWTDRFAMNPLCESDFTPTLKLWENTFIVKHDKNVTDEDFDYAVGLRKILKIWQLKKNHRILPPFFIYAILEGKAHVPLSCSQAELHDPVLKDWRCHFDLRVVFYIWFQSYGQRPVGILWGFSWAAMPARRRSRESNAWGQLAPS